MMKHKIFRALLSLVLVCVLLISWSPIRAQASIIGGAALLFGDDAIAIILAVLAGLGVFAVANSERSDLETRAIAQSALDAMENAGSFVHDGALSVYTSLTEAWSYAVPTGLVQWLHNWMFDTGVVTSVGAHYSANTPCFNIFGSKLTPLHDYNVYRVRWTDTATNKQYAKVLVHLIGGNTYLNSSGTVREATSRKYGNKTYYITFSNTTYRDEFAGYHDLGYIDSAAFSSPAEAALDYMFEHYISVNAPAITTPYDLTLGTVAPSGTDIETEYGEHIVIIAPNGVPDTGGDGGDDEQPKIPVLPIPYLPPNEIPNVPQKDIWNGNKVEIETPDSGGTPDPTIGSDTEPGTSSDTTVSSTPWETFKKWISEGWQSITQAIPTPESIAEAEGNVIKSIFVPDADFISEKWNAIRSRFDFADSISSSGELILDVLNGIDPEPPVIYVDLGDAEGSYYFGGQVAFLDLRWYERYKPTGDAIISAFLWLVFVWRMFIKLPGIIGGLPGDFVMQGVTDLGLADWLPARKKEYENQRQENRRFFKK